MGKLHSHVGIPKCLQLEFAIRDQIQVFDIERNKVYSSNCDRAGTENHYYTDEVENMLSDKVETGLANLIKELKLCKNSCEYTNCLNCHTDVLTSFFKYQLQRSKKMLEGINKQSLTAKVFGDISHSELLKIIDEIDANILGTLGGGQNLYAVKISCSENQYFITNSLGFYLVIDNKEPKYFIIPLSNKNAICIQNGVDKGNQCSYYSMTNEINDYFNKSCYRFELELGNGYIFSKEDFELNDFLKKQGIML